MTIPVEEHRVPPSGSAQFVTIPVQQFDELTRYLGEVAHHLSRLTDEIRAVAVATDSRFAEIRDVVSANFHEVATIAASASEIRSAATQLGGQHPPGLVDPNDIGLERFRESLNQLASDLGDTLIQVSTRLGAAEALGQSIRTAADSFDRGQLDQMAAQLDWLVGAIAQAGPPAH